MTRTLLLDNYDSFTFNLYHLLAEVNEEAPQVVRNDALSWNALRKLDFDNIVISPGPGRPEVPRDFGVCAEVIARAEVPVLGVCLGHQGIALEFGGRITAAREPRHGRSSRIRHDGSGLFAGLPQNFSAVRYHSLVVETPLPPDLIETAWADDGALMGLTHRTRPLFGVQFHPESVCSEKGRALLENFRRLTPTNARTPRPLQRSAERPSQRAPEFELRFVPLVTTLAPEEIFSRLFADRDRAFWLDSSGGTPDVARWSFMGDDQGPQSVTLEYQRSPRRFRIREEGVWSDSSRAPLSVLREELQRKAHATTDVPFPFDGGWVGCCSYEMKGEFGFPTPRASAGPDLHFVFADRFLAFDHVAGRTWMASLVPLNAANGAADGGWFAQVRERVRGPSARDRIPRPVQAPTFVSSRSNATYLSNIDAVLTALGAGETYEVCLTKALRADVRLDVTDFYSTLRRVNPAPFSALLRLGSWSVASSSPERFLRVDVDGTVESKPIKGTRKRGANPDEDVRIAKELAENEKDRAENLMIVDLLRNDLGQVCEVGSVHVPRLMEVESFATVLQLVSTVSGKLRPGLDALDVLGAAFPGGSMTGAPKRRTLEIIDALEAAPRGIYSGTLGYFALSGAADLNIVIRTAVFGPDGVSIGVGGAVVALSNPDDELAEAELKGQALISAFNQYVATAKGSEEESAVVPLVPRDV